MLTYIEGIATAQHLWTIQVCYLMYTLPSLSKLEFEIFAFDKQSAQGLKSVFVARGDCLSLCATPTYLSSVRDRRAAP
jgi:hypothetical protein